MKETTGYPAWVWVVFEKDNQAETLLAQEEEGGSLKFIPAFRNEEDAAVCLSNVVKKPEKKYEVEAMRLPLVAKVARENNLDIFILDQTGRILEKMTPQPAGE